MSALSTSIIGILAPLMPVLVKLIGIWVQKKFVDDPAAYKAYLAFIDSIRKDVPVKLYKGHQEAIRELRREILAEEETNRINKQNVENYQEKYRKLYSDNLKLEDEKVRLQHENDRLRTLE
jgi:pyruvate-formate lyase-activating enzyme